MTRVASVAVLAVAVGVFLLCWASLHHGSRALFQIRDTGLYQQYGDAIAAGQVPYRDFHLEYPPGALPVFVLPSLRHESDTDAYERWFDRLMALCGCLALVGATLALRALEAGPLRTAGALALIAVSPLLLGTVVLSRFDYWPAALAVLAVAALLHERLELSAFAFGAAVAAKLWPVVLVPLALVYVWRTRGRRDAALWGGLLVLVEANIFAPFALMSAGGLGASFHAQLARPLQIESLGAAVLIAWHRAFGSSLGIVTTFGSQNLTGSGVRAVEIGSTVAQVLALVAVWLLFARGPATRERLVAYSAAAVAALLAFSKVFSPQFMVWLVPLVPLVRGRRGVVAGGLLAAALVLTEEWFPRHYWQLALDLAPREAWLLLARDLAIVAIAALLAWPRRSEREALGANRTRVEALRRIRPQTD